MRINPFKIFPTGEWGIKISRIDMKPWAQYTKALFYIYGKQFMYEGAELGNIYPEDAQIYHRGPI